MLARRRGEVIGKHLLDAFPELRGSELDLNLRRALSDKAASSFDTRLDSEPKGLYRAELILLSEPEGIAVLLEHHDRGGQT
jgi:hypothetical protein